MASSNYYYLFTLISIFLYVSITASADSIQGCGGFVEASSELIKSRKSSDPKLDYSNIIVELRTLDGLVKERTALCP
ncbi:nodal modulator 3 [Capsicum chacoense]